MSQSPVFGSPSASWVARSAIDSLLEVRVAERDRRRFVGGRAGRRGQRREVGEARAVGEGHRDRDEHTPRVATMAHTRDVFIFTISIPANQVCVASPARGQAVANEQERKL